MLGAALLGLGYLALRSNPKKAKRRGGRPRGWKTASVRGVRRPPGRWKPTGRRAKWRDLSGKFHTQYSTSWVQRQRNERHGMRIVDEVLREERGRQKLRPGRGRNRRNPAAWSIHKTPHRSNYTRFARRMGVSAPRWKYWLNGPDGQRLGPFGSAKGAKNKLKKLMAGDNPPGVDAHVYHKGGAKTICTSHVLAAFGIDACAYRYSGTSKQRIGVLRRNGYAVRSRLSRVGKGSSVGAARRAIRKLRDPAGTRYMLTLAYGGVVHAILLDANGDTIVDTDPRDADRRRVYTLHAVYKSSAETNPRRRNPGAKRFDIICNGVDFAVVRTGQRPPPAWWIVREAIENKEAAQRMIDSGRISREMLALVNPRRRRKSC